MIDIQELKTLTKELRILYVEDDLTIQKTMSRYLEKIFSNVITANNGKEGLLAYKKQDFDIIITDLNMPLMSGLDMLKNINKINKKQSVIITSAHNESSYMFGAIKLGVDGYILKPFDYEQLNQEIYKIANKLKLLKENENYKNNLKEMVEEKTSKLKDAIDFQKHNYKQTLYSMANIIEDRDFYTAGHSQRVAKYSRLLAKSLGYNEEDCEKLYEAALLHDIGKIAIPDAVLLNPKRLTSEEYKLIQKHAEIGFNFLKNVPMYKDFAEVVHQHHERYDGKGYPQGLKANEILPLARIMIVADAFDAMTTSRIYKTKTTVKDALEELEKYKYKQFHPEIVDKALIVLKDIKIDTSINQLPKTKIEEERFAYFYRDMLCHVFNQDYLNVVLIKNSYEKKFTYLNVILIKKFSDYNKEYGWLKGNKFLIKVATFLNDSFKDSLVFRVFGDDFVVISKEKIPLDELKIKINPLIEKSKIEFFIKSIDLSKSPMLNIEEIENIKIKK